MDVVLKHLPLLLLASLSIPQWIVHSNVSDFHRLNILLNVSWTAMLIGMCLDKYVRSSVGCSLRGANIASESYTIKWGSGVNSFSNYTFLTHPYFLISRSIWHVSLYLFCCLFVRFFKHVCPCQSHLWNWYSVLASGSYPLTEKGTGVFFAFAI